MATEKRLIDANGSFTLNANDNTAHSLCFGGGIISVMDDWGHCICEFDAEDAPTVDAVPVDEIRVDILRLSLENQEAILKVSICGNTNEVKIPFSKEVAEVVHGRWIVEKNGVVICSECGAEHEWIDYRASFCEDCGAKMDGGKL